jgi:hypothetical protein
LLHKKKGQIYYANSPSIDLSSVSAGTALTFSFYRTYSMNTDAITTVRYSYNNATWAVIGSMGQGVNW